EDISIRTGVARLVLRLDPRNPEALAVLRQVLEKREWWSHCRDVVAALGPEAKVVGPSLLRALRHQDRWVYLDAAEVLEAADPHGVAQVGGVAGALPGGRPAGPARRRRRRRRSGRT